MTDKDMTQRNVFKSEMPEICLEICLFHGLRTIIREVTVEKMGITTGDKATALDKIQDIAIAHSEGDYETLCESVPGFVVQYCNKTGTIYKKNGYVD